MRGTMKRNVLLHLVGVLWSNAKGVRRLTVLYMVMAMFAVIVSLCTPLLIARLLNDIQRLSGDELESQAGWLLGAVLGMGMLFWVFHGPSRVIETVLAFRARRIFQEALFRKVTALPMRWHQDHHSGQTIDQISKATQALSDFACCGFEVIHILTRFGGAVLVLTWLMPAAGAAVILVGIAALATIALFDRRIVKQYDAVNKRFSEAAAGVQDYLTNVSTVISLRLEQRVNSEIDGRMERIAPLWRENATVSELKWFTSARFVDLVFVGTLFAYIVYAVRTGKVLEIGTVYALSEYLRSIGDSFFTLTARYAELMVQSRRVYAVEHIEEAYDREVRSIASAALPNGWRTVEVRGLTFSHAGESEENRVSNVDAVDLTLERGRTYALVGESGSGKSTVLGLLRGLHRADEVQVRCNGAVLEHGLAHVAHHSTLIPQDPEIFAETVRFNVTMGVKARPEDIARAMQLARFAHVADRLPKGWDTNVQEKGVSLSGGEKQRLALARGLFFADESRSEIVLMDEPTSSVDIFNERLIYESIFEYLADRCVLSAIHKFHLLHLFDEVLVFAGGKLVERGSLDELLEMNGEFVRLWRNYHQEDEVNVKVTA